MQSVTLRRLVSRQFLRSQLINLASEQASQYRKQSVEIRGIDALVVFDGEPR